MGMWHCFKAQNKSVHALVLKGINGRRCKVRLAEHEKLMTFSLA